MSTPKDNFSHKSNLYARYRPGYPVELYSFLNSLLVTKQNAWDCATGNGQVAKELSDFFENVFATDISQQQIDNAIQKDNIFYSIQSAEQTSFPDNYFDLITVAQAIHWFDFDLFYKEVIRTIKPNGIFAVIGYGLLKVTPDIDAVIEHFYRNTIGAFWDKERKYIDEHYQTIPFPFNEIKAPVLSNQFEWTLEELLGYFETWSAVQHFIKANGNNPVELVRAELQKIWATGSTKKIQFPMLLRVAQISKTSI
jgi:ubiquinone/menaquinone biosynthesis C-methylase UbiE